MRGGPDARGSAAATLAGFAAARAGAGNPPPLRVRRLATGNAIFSTPVVGGDGTAYVGSADGTFYAWNAEADEVRWRFRTRECIDSAAAISRDGARVYVASCDAALYALDAGTGEEAWRLDLLARRERTTPSTIYWFEGNVVEGPSGLLFAGNDDFHVYAIDPASGRVAWAFPTGLNVWSACAFDGEGTLVTASFDLHAYALDERTGRLRWKRDLGNVIAATPAIGPGGRAVIGTFGGDLFTLDVASGRVLARLRLGAPVYASAAIGPDGTAYVGAADGVLSCVSPGGDRARWSFFCGDPIRSSAALGPDPEGLAPYLVYVGAGDGRIHAIDPEGRRRWAFDSAREAPRPEFPDVNASIALSARGLVTATAGGEVIFVPYGAYLSPDAEARGFSREASDGWPLEGASLHRLSLGGRPAPRPAGEPISIHATEPLALRALLRRAGTPLPPRIAPGDVRVAVRSEGTTGADLPPLTVHVQPDGARLAISFDAPLPSGARFEVDVEAGPFRARVPLEVRAPASPPAPLDRLPELPFRVERMSVYAPTIVPSFDQIGIASLRIDIRVLRVDAASGRCIAFGVKKFGVDASGALVGVPVPRSLLYAFEGRFRDGALQLTARRCRFELTAAPVPLGRLRLAGVLDAQGAPDLGATLIAETRVRGVSDLVASDADGGTRGGLLARGKAAIGALQGVSRYLRTWAPEGAGPLGALAALGDVARFAAKGYPFVRELFAGRLHRPWSLVHGDGRFVGVGTFRAVPLPARVADAASLGARLGQVRVERRPEGGLRVSASLERAGAGASPALVPAILPFDEGRMAPLPIALDAGTRVRRGSGGAPEEVSIDISAAALEGCDRPRAIVLADLAELADVALSAR